MSYLTDLADELARSEPARAAMTILEGALARRSDTEQGAFWHAVGLAYIARKAPPEVVGAAVASALDAGREPALTA